MKPTKSLWLALFATIVLQSCKDNQVNTEQNGLQKKEFKQLEKARWFMGDWENLVNDAHFTEIWSQKNDSTLLGKSFVTVKNDTVFAEEVNLLQRNDSLFYIVNVKGQNNEKPVSFHLTKAAKNELVFENPQHDFPTKITYKKITDDLMVATISGMKDGKQSSDEYEFKRKQQ